MCLKNKPIRFPQADAKPYFVVLRPYVHHEIGCVLNYYLKSFPRLVACIDGVSSYQNVEALLLQYFYISFDACTCTIWDNTQLRGRTLRFCELRYSHGGDSEDCCILGCDVQRHLGLMSNEPVIYLVIILCIVCVVVVTVSSKSVINNKTCKRRCEVQRRRAVPNNRATILCSITVETAIRAVDLHVMPFFQVSFFYPSLQFVCHLFCTGWGAVSPVKCSSCRDMQGAVGLA